mmetsp:Transcript_9746/g.17783  ORF Transcript_9746/g.17783 Transcript_9746/m.17783 type:complete len:193 (-) Transcript_9746:115-693(-)|eukprot:CAMPEP_0197526702 /NCGR_PEP_ID=MMETSP1318-20131121/18951_1 /TAXON_ID=552666 /ORGANISM="Partenskyella glossopodia, Strain RCC365" /LENGTH=192 /DNA_ID=CAMNT_0043080989 /DNA_START=44 /DNA_END=622 /DNA_ORIENTATION=+
MEDYEKRLLGVYLTLSLAFTAWAKLFGSAAASPAGAALFGSLWLGFVLALSLMEAWVKFHSPLLKKGVGFDVGARVFRCLNFIEAIFALNMLLLSGFCFIWTILAAMVTAQIGHMTPALSKLGSKHAALSLNPDHYEAEGREYLISLQKISKSFKPPWSGLHITYVLMDFLKAMVLPFYISICFSHTLEASL